MGEVKKDLRSTLARVDWDAFKEVDPRNEEFQSNMYKKAIALADKMLDDAMHEEGVGPKAKALDAFIKYRAHLNADTTYPMELLLQLTPEQIEVLKANLKEKSLLKGFQSAKLTLNDLCLLYTSPSPRD